MTALRPEAGGPRVPPAPLCPGREGAPQAPGADGMMGWMLPFWAVLRAARRSHGPRRGGMCRASATHSVPPMALVRRLVAIPRGRDRAGGRLAWQLRVPSCAAQPSGRPARDCADPDPGARAWRAHSAAVASRALSAAAEPNVELPSSCIPMPAARATSRLQPWAGVLAAHGGMHAILVLLRVAEAVPFALVCPHGMRIQNWGIILST